MANRRSNFANAWETRLVAPVGATDTSFQIEEAPGAPSSPAYVVFEAGTDSKREVVYCDGSFDATHLRTTSLSNRFLAGSAASSGLTHDADTKVSVVPVAQWFIDVHDRIDAVAASAGGGGVTDHGALTGLGDDDHPQYLTPAEHSALDHSGFSSSFPSGTVTMFGGSSAPAGWLLCRGQAVSRSTYANLFAVIGTTYGAGDGSTTFNLPNLQGRFPVGVSTSDSDHNAGVTGGAKNVALTEAQMPSHGHTGTSATNSHTHTGSSSTSTTHSHSGTAGTDSHAHSGSTGSDSHNHGGSTGTGGWTRSSDQTQGYSSIAQNVAADTSSHSHSISSDSHSHTVSVGSISHSHSIAIGAGGAHSHTMSLDNTSHSHTFTTATAGSGAAHENRPPYLSINFIIKT